MTPIDDTFLVAYPIFDLDDESEYSESLNLRGEGTKDKFSRVKMSDLKRNIELFINDWDKAFKDIELTLEKMTLDEIKITLGITATGKIALVSVGGEGEVQGGIELVFKRKIV